MPNSRISRSTSTLSKSRNLILPKFIKILSHFKTSTWDYVIEDNKTSSDIFLGENKQMWLLKLLIQSWKRKLQKKKPTNYVVNFTCLSNGFHKIPFSSWHVSWTKKNAKQKQHSYRWNGWASNRQKTLVGQREGNFKRLPADFFDTSIHLPLREIWKMMQRWNTSLRGRK